MAYDAGPSTAIFAGSWLCSKSPVDGSPIALGEPVGDCGDPEAVSRLSSIATAVHLLKAAGAKVFFAGAGDEALAAFAGGADGLLGDLKHRVGVPDAPDESAFVLIQATSLEEYRRTVRRAGEIYKRGVEVVPAGDFESLMALAPYAPAVALTSVGPIVRFSPAAELPEVGRCAHCGIDFLMYGARISRCPYCGRRLMRLITDKRPPLRPEVLRSVHRRLASIPKPLRLIIT